MLKNIPGIISPELMKILMEMGHGDEICLCDANYPAASASKDCKLVRMDGHKIPEILDAILQFYPLDNFIAQPVVLMDVEGEAPSVWEEYDKIVKERDFIGAYTTPEHMERFSFYDRVKKCYALVATTETAGYANIILRKGAILD